MNEKNTEQSSKTTLLPMPIFVAKCRLCLRNPGTFEVFQENGLSLSREISFFTGVKMSPSDNLPQSICSYCKEIVINAKELRKIAMKNDAYLHLVLEVDSDAETFVIDDSQNSAEQTVDRIDSRALEHKRVNTSTPRTSTSPNGKAEDFKLSKTLRFETDRVFEFQCEACNKTFDTRKKLYLHERVHNKKISCPREDCRKLFTTKGDLNKHLRTHTGARPFACHICDKKFTQKVTLKLHKENVHYVYEFSIT